MHVIILIDLVNYVKLNQSINWLKCWERKDNASMFLFNAFMKKMFTFWEVVHSGQLSENTYDL